jgi:two-component system C4-dicarboxylate transport sensor histidine kinase DctB
MSTSIGHELNQPLSAIRSYADNAQALLDHERLDDAHWNLAQISDLTARMAQIIKQLKVFARKTTQQLESVPLQTAVDGSLSLLSARINREGAEIINDLAAKELFVTGDMVRLEQVFVNLIANALQAMSESERPRLYINARSIDGKVTITLRDTGPGIPREHRFHIFDPFFTTKEAGQGLGLGLAISYRIIEGMGGTIRAANHPDGGAVFTVELSPAPQSQESAHD